MGNNRFMVVSEEKDIIVMNPSHEQLPDLRKSRPRPGN